MSAVLGFAKGYSPKYLTQAVATGREGYYTGAVAAGEPPGQWWGSGARELGLRGEVDNQLMEAIYSRLLDPRDAAIRERERWAECATLGKPHKRYVSAQQLFEEYLQAERERLGTEPTPERREELEKKADRDSRQAIAFFDMTFSPDKSITVTWVALERAANEAAAAGDHQAAAHWSQMAKAVEEAVMQGARATIDYLEEHAGYARVGKHGGGANRWGDAHNFVVAQFLQHDSREREPQLHVHQAILNRQQRADGQWVGLDESALRLHRAAAAAIGERVTETRLVEILGGTWRYRDGKRELVGVPVEVMEMFSTRRQQVTKRGEEMVRKFEERVGREASVLERKHIYEKATLKTRRAKSHDGETREEQLDRWEREAASKLKVALARVARNVLERPERGAPESWSEEKVIDQALWQVGKNRADWTRSDLIFAISQALPANLGLAPEQVRPLLEGLADKALERAVTVVGREETKDLPREFKLQNGLSAFQRPGSEKFATPKQMVHERLLEQAAVRTGAPQLTNDQVDFMLGRLAEAGIKLSKDQEKTVRGVATSGAFVEVLQAAAGTGKSFAVGTLAELWKSFDGRRVIGLTASQNAADVLADEGVTAFNFEKWRLDTARSPEWQLRAGDLVVVDEAGMASTDDLAEIARKCEEAGAKLLLVGDPYQLAAVGPGGALADVGEKGIRYELTEVRRFSHAWEGPASLRLRDGDLSALDDYDKHGRLRAGGTTEQAEWKASRAWLADTLAGRRSLLLVGSNEAAARVNGMLRAELVRLGKVAEDGVALEREGTVAGAGDLIQARRNHWRLGIPVINRQTFTVEEALEDGSLRVVRKDGKQITLPANYVREHVSLAYASTVHAAQGRTVDTAHGVVDRGDAHSVYVMATRGRDSNTLWVTTQPTASDAPVGEAREVKPRSARAVLADMMERAEVERGALAQQAQELDASKSTFRLFDRLIAGIQQISGGRTSSVLDRLAAEGVITEEQRALFANDKAMGSVERLLRHAEVDGHDPAELVRKALEGKDLSGARSVGQVLHSRLRREVGPVAPRITSYRDLIPRWTPDRWRPYLESLADRADMRRHELGARIAEEKPQWAIETLGEVPEDPVERAEWERRAGWSAAYRENMQHDDERDPLGPAPPTGLAEKHAVWVTAREELGLPDATAEEALLSDGALLARVTAWDRERKWAPRHVAQQLAATNEEIANLRTSAELWTAHAETLTDEEEREHVERAAHEARERADQLEMQALQLEEADLAREIWFKYTAKTREYGERARAELIRRGKDPADTSDHVTAEDWLAAQRAAQLEEEKHLPVYESDVVEEREPLEEPVRTHTETAVPDIREVAEPDPTEREAPEPRRYVPEVDETVAAVARAREALLEIEARDEGDAWRVAEEMAERQRGRAVEDERERVRDA